MIAIIGQAGKWNNVVCTAAARSEQVISIKTNIRFCGAELYQQV